MSTEHDSEQHASQVEATSDMQRDSTEDHQGPDTAEKTSNRHARFSHWRRAARVVSAKRHRGLLSALVAAAVLVIIFMVMLLGGHKRPHSTAEQPEWTNNNDGILRANAKKLAKMRTSQEITRTPSFPQESYQPDKKALMARLNAPTTMYSAAADNKPSLGEAQENKTLMAEQDAFTHFANTQSAQTNTVFATKIAHPKVTIAAGEFIQAVLETAINSDLPGMVRAVITEPVYSYTGEAPLIPAGSRLMGQYAAMASNQSATVRVFVIWNRIVTPSGISIRINSPGSDALGRAGMGADRVDSHFWKMFGTASLLSVMGAATANTGVNAADQPNSADSYRQSIASAFQQSAQNSLNQGLNIKPTLHIDQGDAVTVFVAQDLDLFSVLESAS